MGIRPRFTIRAALIAIAALAVFLGGLSEWTDVRERDFYASQERFFLDQGWEMERIASDCRVRAGSGPFDPTDPTWIKLDRQWGLAKERVPDWDAAAWFFTDLVTGTRRTAAQHSRLKQFHQGRILLLH